ncbi:MAG: CRISPR-associated protein Cas4 [Firmicutes bacterium]|nr:CRISPR-associated protein Cas4 [Bacillota bacterium]
MSHFSDDDLLALSGIQHFAFCQRQWALIHVEKQWAENLRTVQGKQLHERVDNPDFFESRGDILTTRSVPLSSYVLGLYGVADMIEFHAVEQGGVKLNGRDGEWLPVPIEYKRGRPKRDNIDEVQVCAQALCLEEMLNIEIHHGFIFYGETRHRDKVIFHTELRNSVEELAKQMHSLFKQNITPRPNYTSACKSCSLVDMCIPKLDGKHSGVAKYINKFLSRELL